jgi:hypothetical protein
MGSVMISKPPPCADCGYQYVPADAETNRMKVGMEIVYMATRGLDEPYLCQEHRQHK